MKTVVALMLLGMVAVSNGVSANTAASAIEQVQKEVEIWLVQNQGEMEELRWMLIDADLYSQAGMQSIHNQIVVDAYLRTLGDRK